MMLLSNLLTNAELINIVISGPMPHMHSRKLAHSLDKVHFKASDGWLSKFNNKKELYLDSSVAKQAISIPYLFV